MKTLEIKYTSQKTVRDQANLLSTITHAVYACKERFHMHYKLDALLYVFPTSSWSLLNVSLHYKTNKVVKQVTVLYLLTFLAVIRRIL